MVQNARDGAQRLRTNRDRATRACVVIFGASGDLTKRKLIPALYNLQTPGFLPRNFAVVGVAADADEQRAVPRRGRSPRTSCSPPSRCARRGPRSPSGSTTCRPTSTNPSRPAAWPSPRRRSTPSRHAGQLPLLPLGPARRSSPRSSSTSGRRAATEESGRWRRVIIEKPFGHDLPSAVELNRNLKAVLGEKQIYRIDHYLGKETVQNIMVFRFANGMFEPIWNRHYIDHVQITVAEELGVEGAAATTTPPARCATWCRTTSCSCSRWSRWSRRSRSSADAVRDEKVKVLRRDRSRSRPRTCCTDAVRGQYGEGDGATARRCPAYRAGGEGPARLQHRDLRRDAADGRQLALGRRAVLPAHRQAPARSASPRSSIQFKRAPAAALPHTAVEQLTPNRLVIHIQPDEGISLRFGAKVPGPVLTHGRGGDGLRLRGLLRASSEHRLRDAALRLHDRRCDAVPARRHGRGGLGDGAADPRRLEGAARRGASPTTPPGTWGPTEADELLARDGRHWENSGSDPRRRHRRDQHPPRRLSRPRPGGCC